MTPGAADLHTHSKVSDGSDSPRELVLLAKRAGLGAFSLTDHDSVAGIDEARRESRLSGITFIPGVELSVSYEGGEIHLLGYGIDASGRELRETLDRLAAERVVRMEKMVQRLREKGIPAVFDEVRKLAGGKILSRLHLAAYLYQGRHVGSMDEAFSLYIGNGRPAYVRRRLLDLKGAFSLITGSGGVPVLAHPALTGRDDLIEYLVRLGLRGIEVYYPKHSPSSVSRYEKICGRYGLIATGGSDYHGSAKAATGLGSALTPPRELERLLRHIRT